MTKKGYVSKILFWQLATLLNLIQEDEVNERIHNLAAKYDDIVVTMRCKLKDIFIMDQI